MKRKAYEIDGSQFSDLDGFFDEISVRIFSGATWGRNLNAFNDILRGGFGTPEEGFIFVWKNADVSRSRLGHEETIKHLERTLKCCHPSSRAEVRNHLEKARRREGPTIFDWLVDIIERHGAGGEESEDQVELKLE